MDANAFRDKLVQLLALNSEILGIAQTGDINAPLIPGKSDIDIFVLCGSVPSKAQRAQMYAALAGDYDELQMEVCSGGIWGSGDVFIAGGTDVMPMYFTEREMREYTSEVLDGLHLEKEGRFYPIGRLASIETINVLYEKDGAWSDIINRIKAHPRELFEKWYLSESSRIIDEEDLGRAVLRHEVLFFHQVTEEFFDHFLQALYAKNNCYFPSRKRTEAAISGFEKKPKGCYKRLVRVARLAACEDTIDDAVAEIRALAAELEVL